MNGFTITTLRTIQRGEEVFDSYGRKCNSRFFVNYGFALTDNEDNEGGIVLSQTNSDQGNSHRLFFMFILFFCLFPY